MSFGLCYMIFAIELKHSRNQGRRI